MSIQLDLDERLLQRLQSGAALRHQALEAYIVQLLENSAPDPFLAALAGAEEDSEPLTEEEEQAIHEGFAEIRRGEKQTLEEIRKQLQK